MTIMRVTTDVYNLCILTSVVQGIKFVDVDTHFKTFV
jgi:hypothetical protein